MSRRRAIGSLALLVFLLTAHPADAEDGSVQWVVLGGREEAILSLVAPNKTLAPVLPGTWFDRIEIQEGAIVFTVSGREPSAAPVFLRLSWDMGAADIDTPPPWNLEVQGEAGTEALAESVALLRGRIEARLTPELYQDLLRPVTDPGGAVRRAVATWVEHVQKTLGLVWRDRRDRGILQFSLEEIDRTGPALPPGWLLFSLLALAAAGIAGGLRRLRRYGPALNQAIAWWPLLVSCFVGAAGLAAWWLHAPLSEAGVIIATKPQAVLDRLVPTIREFVVAGIFMAVGVALSVALLLDAIRRARGSGAGRLVLEAGAVLAVSLWIRLYFTAPNLFTDGAGAFERLLQYGSGQGGASILISWILPGQAEGFIWPAVRVMTVLSACGPPLLYLLARAMALPRSAALLAALALAAWPLHAALSASDLLAGPMMALSLGGLALAFAALRWDRPVLLLGAAAVLAVVIWWRPDGVLILLPAAVPGIRAARRWPRRMELLGAAAWLVLAMVCREIAVAASPAPLLESPNPAGGGGQPVFPWWLWVGVPAGIVALRVLWEAALTTRTGDGFEAVAARLARRPWGQGLVLLLAAGILVVPMVHRDRLGTSHGLATSDRAFRRALMDVDATCGVVVAGETAEDGLDQADRHRLIAWEEFERNPDLIRGDRVIAASDFTEHLMPEMGGVYWYAFTVGETSIRADVRLVPLAKYCDDCTLSWVEPLDGAGDGPPHRGMWDLPRGGEGNAQRAPTPQWVLESFEHSSEWSSGTGVERFSWWDVRLRGPGPFPTWLLLLLLGAIGGAGFLALWGGRGLSTFAAAPRRFGPVLVLLGSAAVTVLWWWMSRGLPEPGWDGLFPAMDGGRPEMTLVVREFALVNIILGVAVVGVVVAALAGLRRLAASGVTRDALATVGLAVLVLGISMIIRLGFTEPNILTDGGTGHDRVLTFWHDFGGLSVLISWLLPGQLEGRIWPGIRVLTILSSLAPVSLLLLSLGAGLRRSVAVLAALALACWPLHAALYTSDFLNGGILSLNLAGLAFGVGALRLNRAWLLLPGAGLLAFSVWCRPEAVLHLIPAAVIAVLAVRRWARRAEVWAAAAWVGLSVTALLFSGELRAAGQDREIRFANLVFIHWESLVHAGFVAFPWWLLLGLLPGAAAGRRPRWLSFLIVAGLLSGWAPMVLGGVPEDLLEGFRYGTFLCPWLAITSATGLHWLVSRVPAGRWRMGALGLVIAAVALTPLFHLDYLGTIYGARASDEAFRRVLRAIPATCGVVVPGERRDDGLDPAKRYPYIAWEERDDDQAVSGGGRVISAVEFLDAVRDGRVPRVAEDSPDGEAFERDPCWYVFFSGECQATQEMSRDFPDPGTCRALEAALDLEPVEIMSRGFRFHRLIAQPGVTVPPLYAADFPVRLMRVKHQQTQDDRR